MADAIEKFSGDHPVSHLLPEDSIFQRVLYASNTSSTETPTLGKRVAFSINSDLQIFKLEIDVRGNLDDDQWRSISDKLLEWRKAFSVSADLFSH
ncbi:MAG: hypothetical protein KR126chlam3_01034 [Chlamydiae bacterium]|nr:hypothetical protein [Chlamydiota bacterium]